MSLEISFNHLREFSNDLLNLIKVDFAGLNLTKILDPEEFYQKQIIDSVIPLKEGPVFLKRIQEVEKVVDVGFGGGFPLLPLAFLFPKKLFIGFDARKKKVQAVDEMARKLGLKNVHVYHKRIEEVLIDEKVMITFKAVGQVKDCLKNINPIDGVSVYFYKGPDLINEKTDIKGWKQIEIASYRIHDLERTLIGFESKNVPRRTFAKINLVKVSELN